MRNQIYLNNMSESSRQNELSRDQSVRIDLDTHGGIIIQDFTMLSDLNLFPLPKIKFGKKSLKYKIEKWKVSRKIFPTNVDLNRVKNELYFLKDNLLPMSRLQNIQFYSHLSRGNHILRMIRADLAQLLLFKQNAEMFKSKKSEIIHQWHLLNLHVQKMEDLYA